MNYSRTPLLSINTLCIVKVKKTIKELNKTYFQMDSMVNNNKINHYLYKQRHILSERNSFPGKQVLWKFKYLKNEFGNEI